MIVEQIVLSNLLRFVIICLVLILNFINGDAFCCKYSSFLTGFLITVA